MMRFFQETAALYNSVPREQIADALIHLRGLFREIPPTNDEEFRAKERRELLTKNLLSNLFRTKEHPTIHAVLQVADAFSLTLDGAHRLFGYELEGIRECDFQLNSGRTHIIETYPFERDRLIDLPFRFGDDEAFARSSTVQDLVLNWNFDTPIRSLESVGWQQPSAFYVRVGTEDSLGGSLPPGAVALVMPVGEAERLRPNPRAIYLLQFGNGYRCSRCVVSRGNLILLTSGRRYTGPQEFSYPHTVRIAGRIRTFAVSLPVPEYPLLRSLPPPQHGAPLILPWEHTSIDRLLRAKHHRFRRSRQELVRMREAMESIFQSKLSGRTERRYRRPTPSLPHVDGLIQLTVSHLARYTDVLRVQHLAHSDRGKYSLNTLLNARHLHDLFGASRRPQLPVPRERWTELRNDFIEWPSILSLRNPELHSLGERIVRLPEGAVIEGLDPPISAGSFVLLDKIQLVSDIHRETKLGWGRRIYALRRGENLVFGHLDKEGDQYVLLTGAKENEANVPLHQNELHNLSSVSGVAVPL